MKESVSIWKLKEILDNLDNLFDNLESYQREEYEQFNSISRSIMPVRLILIRMRKIIMQAVWYRPLAVLLSLDQLLIIKIGDLTRKSMKNCKLEKTMPRIKENLQ